MSTVNGVTSATIVGVVDSVSERQIVVRCTRKSRRDGKPVERSVWIPVRLPEGFRLPNGLSRDWRVLVEARISASGSQSGGNTISLHATRVFVL